MIDVLLNDDMTVRIENGDFVYGDATLQNQRLLIVSSKTDFKETPMRCIGAHRFVEEEQLDAFAREIRQEFTLDGMKVNEIKFDDTAEIAIDATYQTNGSNS